MVSHLTLDFEKKRLNVLLSRTFSLNVRPYKLCHESVRPFRVKKKKRAMLNIASKWKSVFACPGPDVPLQENTREWQFREDRLTLQCRQEACVESFRQIGGIPPKDFVRATKPRGHKSGGLESRGYKPGGHVPRDQVRDRNRSGISCNKQRLIEVAERCQKLWNCQKSTKYIILKIDIQSDDK